MEASNVKAMREALEFAARSLLDATESDEYGDDVVYLVGCMRIVAKACNAALSAPARRCARFTGADAIRGEELNTHRIKPMDRKTIYIAGQMAGLPDNNFEAFDAAEIKLQNQGWFVVNPYDFDKVFGENPTGKLLDAVCESERAAIPFLDAIYLLKGWEKSKGARRELEVALRHNLMVIVEEQE